MSIRLSSHMKKWMACHQWLKLGQIFREYGNRSKNQIKDLEQMFGKSTVLMWKMFPYARHNTWHIDLVTNCVSSNCRLRTLKCTLYHTSASYIYIYKYVSDYSTHTFPHALLDLDKATKLPQHTHFSTMIVLTWYIWTHVTSCCSFYLSPTPPSKVQTSLTATAHVICWYL